MLVFCGGSAVFLYQRQLYPKSPNWCINIKNSFVYPHVTKLEMWHMFNENSGTSTKIFIKCISHSWGVSFFWRLWLHLQVEKHREVFIHNLVLITWHVKAVANVLTIKRTNQTFRLSKMGHNHTFTQDSNISQRATPQLLDLTQKTSTSSHMPWFFLWEYVKKIWAMFHYCQTFLSIWRREQVTV